MEGDDGSLLGRTTKISGSRPWTIHHAQRIRESAASRSSRRSPFSERCHYPWILLPHAGITPVLPDASIQASIPIHARTRRSIKPDVFGRTPAHHYAQGGCHPLLRRQHPDRPPLRRASTRHPLTRPASRLRTAKIKGSRPSGQQSPTTMPASPLHRVVRGSAATSPLRRQ